jgi:hypothetical protein
MWLFENRGEGEDAAERLEEMRMLLQRICRCNGRGMGMAPCVRRAEGLAGAIGHRGESRVEFTGFPKLVGSGGVPVPWWGRGRGRGRH